MKQFIKIYNTSDVIIINVDKLVSVRYNATLLDNEYQYCIVFRMLDGKIYEKSYSDKDKWLEKRSALDCFLEKQIDNMFNLY